MFQKIQGNVQADSEKCSRRLWGVFKEISRNVTKYPDNAQEGS